MKKYNVGIVGYAGLAADLSIRENRPVKLAEIDV